MAEVTTQLARRHRGRPAIYDWERYSNGEFWVCHEGQDFETSPVSFRALVHHTARTRGLKAETQIDKNKGTVTFRMFNPDLIA